MNSKVSLEETKQNLRSQIEQAFKKSRFAKSQILRFETEIDPLSILAWLAGQNTTSKIYWSDRDGKFEVGGIGLAYALHGTNVIDYDAIFCELQKYLTQNNPSLKFFGGLAFSKNSLDKNWEPFGKYRFILPRFEILRRGGETFFTCNIFPEGLTQSRLKEILSELDNLDLTPRGGFKKLPLPVFRTDEPSQNRWTKELQSIVSRLTEDSFQKVVLARRSHFKFPKALDPISFLQSLKNISPNCFHFCFTLMENYAFLGASPERLYNRQGRSIHSEALAGTRPRGESTMDDIKFKNELLNSDKDRLEHMFVSQGIQKALNELCTNVTVQPQTTVLPFKSGHHLLTSFVGTLKEDVGDALILKFLHPTPAVGGLPIEKALKTIQRFEPFKRGWYAGPVGFVGFDTAEFAVGIRSGLICRDELFLYAGAGIVQGSSPADEWNEIETKISNFVAIFKNGKDVVF